MSFSFSETLPTNKDLVRAALDDRNAAAPLRSDEEITATLVLFAAAARPIDAAVGWLAAGLASKYRNAPGSYTDPDGTSVSWKDRATGWYQLAKDLRSGVMSFEEPVAAAAGSWQAPVQLAAGTLEPPPAGW